MVELGVQATVLTMILCGPPIRIQLQFQQSELSVAGMGVRGRSKGGLLEKTWFDLRSRKAGQGWDSGRTEMGDCLKHMAP